jgi:hypothetical protein
VTTGRYLNHWEVENNLKRTSKLECEANISNDSLSDNLSPVDPFHLIRV